MKLLFLLAFTLLAVNVFSAATDEEEDALLKELLEKEKEAADEPETEKEEGEFERDEENETEDEDAKTEPIENDEPELMDAEKVPFDPEETFDDEEEMKEVEIKE
ncbi:hypothetical protein ACROYT_G042758 [Oculina patagonica]